MAEEVDEEIEVVDVLSGDISWTYGDQEFSLRSGTMDGAEAMALFVGDDGPVAVVPLGVLFAAAAQYVQLVSERLGSESS